MREIRVGDRFRDNDPRIRNRVLVVDSFLNDLYALCVTECSGRRTSVRRSRLGNSGHSGYLFLDNEKEEAEMNHCPSCGAELSLLLCPDCKGQGRVQEVVSRGSTATATDRKCKTCAGTGCVSAEEELKEAVKADSERFSDAWKTLANEEDQS